MKKSLALFLAMLMLLSTALFACSQPGDVTTDTTAAPDTTQAPSDIPDVTDTTVPEETKLVANIPDVKYDYTFNIANGFHNQTKYTTNAIAPHEQTGDVISDAMQRRTLIVEEKLGITIADLDISQSQMKTVLGANSAEFDLMTVDLSGVRTFINAGYVLDFNELPGIDLDMPWWDQNAKEKLSVQGKLYHTFSDFLITHLDNSRALFFNKQMAEDLELGNLYDVARSGNWTLDKMREYGMKAVNDVNGDQTMDAQDRYGMLCWNSATSFYEIYLTASDAEIMKKGDNGIPYFYCYDENFQTVCERLLGIFNTDNFTRLDENGLKMFMEGNGLFLSYTLLAAKELRAMTTDYGVLPFPKYDESQESYWHVSPNPHALMVPVHVDQERTGVILEALAYYSSPIYAGNNSVPYAYFDNAVKVRATRDADSFEMLDLIRNTISYIIKFDDSPLTSSIYTCFTQGQNLFSSLIAKLKKTADTKLATAFENMGVVVE